MSTSKKSENVRINNKVSFDDRVKYLDNTNIRPKSCIISDKKIAESETKLTQEKLNTNNKKNNFRINNQEENSILDSMKKKQKQIENLKKEKNGIINRQMEKVQLLKEQNKENEIIRNEKIKMLRQNLGIDRQQENKRVNKYNFSLDITKLDKEANIPAPELIPKGDLLHKKERFTMNNIEANKYSKPQLENTHKDFLYYSKIENTKMTTINEVEDNESVDNLTDNKAYQYETRSNILNSTTVLNTKDESMRNIEFIASNDNIFGGSDKKNFNNSKKSSTYTVEPLSVTVESRKFNDISSENFNMNPNEVFIKNLNLNSDSIDPNYINPNYTLLSRREMYDISNSSKDNTERSNINEEKLLIPEANFNLEKLSTMQSNVLRSNSNLIMINAEKSRTKISPGKMLPNISNKSSQSSIKIKLLDAEFDKIND